MTKRISYPYRNSNNQRITKQLFHENVITLAAEERYPEGPPFSLYRDVPGCVNFGRLYIELEDPTGYKIAMKIFKDYEFWNVLMRSQWFREAKETWDTEIEAKLHSEAVDKIKEIARGEGGPALAAARFIAGKEYKDAKASKKLVGRPSKEEVAGALKQDKDAEKALQSDLERIGLRSVK